MYYFNTQCINAWEAVYQSWQCWGVAADRGRGDAEASRLVLHAGEGCSSFNAGVKLMELCSVSWKVGVAGTGVAEAMFSIHAGEGPNCSLHAGVSAPSEAGRLRAAAGVVVVFSLVKMS